MHTVPRPLDVVALMADLPSRGLRRGQVGTVVQILGGACKVSSRTTTAAHSPWPLSRPNNSWCCTTGRRGCIGARRRTSGGASVLGLFERANSKLTAHCRKVVAKRIERLAAFAVVEQRLERHASSREHGRAAHDLGVAMNSRAKHWHAVIVLRDSG